MYTLPLFSHNLVCWTQSSLDSVVQGKISVDDIVHNLPRMPAKLISFIRKIKVLWGY